jgi:hypothetical protein
MVSARKIACHEPDPNVTNAVTGRVALPVSGKTVSAQVRTDPMPAAGSAQIRRSSRS